MSFKDIQTNYLVSKKTYEVTKLALDILVDSNEELNFLIEQSLDLETGEELDKVHNRLEEIYNEMPEFNDFTKAVYNYHEAENKLLDEFESIIIKKSDIYAEDIRFLFTRIKNITVRERIIESALKYKGE